MPVTLRGVASARGNWDIVYGSEFPLRSPGFLCGEAWSTRGWWLESQGGAGNVKQQPCVDHSAGTYAASSTHNTHLSIPLSGNGAFLVLLLSCFAPLTTDSDRPYQIKRREL